MSYLIDTDWVAFFLKNDASALELLTDLSQEGLAISLITYGEIYEGIYYGRDAKKHEQGFRAFLQEVDVLPLNKRIMKRFALIRGELRARGMIITDSDILIAATAIEYQLTIVTNNKRHFERVPGLLLY